MPVNIEASPDVTIVFSFDECNFTAVLESFPKAQWVDILTYNISAGDSSLFEQLAQLDQSVPIRVITNIPARWDKYLGNGPIRRFRTQLQSYLMRLDPKLYHSFEAFFNVSNHSKIIMTNLTAYVGSANYSSESSQNFECGVIFRNPEIIEQLRSQCFESVLDGSVPRSLSEVGVAKLWIKGIRNGYKELLRAIVDGFMAAPDDLGEMAKVFLWKDAEVSEEVLVRFQAFLDEWEQVQRTYRDHLQLSDVVAEIDIRLIEKCRQHVEYDDGPLMKLARFNIQDATNRYFQEEYSLESYDERLSAGLSYAAEDAENERNELIYQSKQAIKELLSIFNQLEAQYNAVFSKLQKLEETAWGIDNA